MFIKLANGRYACSDFINTTDNITLAGQFGSINTPDHPGWFFLTHNDNPKQLLCLMETKGVHPFVFVDPTVAPPKVVIAPKKQEYTRNGWGTVVKVPQPIAPPQPVPLKIYLAVYPYNGIDYLRIWFSGDQTYFITCKDNRIIYEKNPELGVELLINTDAVRKTICSQPTSIAQV